MHAAASGILTLDVELLQNVEAGDEGRDVVVVVPEIGEIGKDDEAAGSVQAVDQLVERVPVSEMANAKA